MDAENITYLQSESHEDLIVVMLNTVKWMHENPDCDVVAVDVHLDDLSGTWRVEWEYTQDNTDKPAWRFFWRYSLIGKPFTPPFFGDIRSE